MGIFGAVGGILAAIIAAVTAAGTVVTNFFPRVKRGFYGVKFKSGKFKLDEDTTLDVIQRDGIDNAYLYTERMPPTLWPKEELIIVPSTDQVVNLPPLTVDLPYTQAEREIQQQHVATIIATWGVAPSEKSKTNYAARAVVVGEISTPPSLAKLENLVAKVCSGALWKVFSAQDATIGQLRDAEFLLREVLSLSAGALLVYGCELRGLSVVSLTRTPIQVLVDGGQKGIEALNGHTVPALEAAQVDVGVQL